MSPHRAAAYASIAVVGVAIAVGLYFSGSPSEQRMVRLDGNRVGDLRQLSAAVDGYFTETGELPADLDALVDGRRLSSVPRDPVTDEPYEYAVLGERRFELCAEFSRESAFEPPRSFWAHGAGRECFEFDFSDRRPVPVPR